MSNTITPFQKYKILTHEIEVLKSRIQPHDTGHIHTTISTLQSRVEELEEEINASLHNSK